jgi:hypothetical protein
LNTTKGLAAFNVVQRRVMQTVLLYGPVSKSYVGRIFREIVVGRCPASS